MKKTVFPKLPRKKTVIKDNHSRRGKRPQERKRPGG